jgi:hypothetical protein
MVALQDLVPRDLKKAALEGASDGKLPEIASSGKNLGLVWKREVRPTE